jgi:hypothetical protein
VSAPTAAAIRIGATIIRAPLNATETELRQAARDQGVMFAEMRGAEFGWIVGEAFVGRRASSLTVAPDYRAQDSGEGNCG